MDVRPKLEQTTFASVIEGSEEEEFIEVIEALTETANLKSVEETLETTEIPTTVLNEENINTEASDLDDDEELERVQPISADFTETHIDTVHNEENLTTNFP